VRHLLGKCPVCQARAQEVVAQRQNPAIGPKKYDYERAFGKAERALSYFLKEDGPTEEPPGELLAEIVLLSDREEGLPLPSENRFSIPFLIRWLVDRSHAYRYRNPEKVLEFALLARLAADACSAEIAGSAARLADLRCRAWGQLGNALRICSRLSEAEEMLAKAQEYGAGGTGDPLFRGLFFNWLAPLHYFERRLIDARRASEDAEAIYKDLGETQLLARARVQRSVYEIELGGPERAVPLIRGTIPLINRGEDPYLLLAAYHNLARCHVDLGRPSEALNLYSAAKSLNPSSHDSLILSRFAWQEGKIFHQLGNVKAAEAAFIRAREGFAELDLVFEVTLLANQLANLYLEVGAADKLERSVSQTLSYCSTRNICREAKSSLDELQEIIR